MNIKKSKAFGWIPRVMVWAAALLAGMLHSEIDIVMARSSSFFTMFAAPAYTDTTATIYADTQDAPALQEEQQAIQNIWSDASLVITPAMLEHMTIRQAIIRQLIAQGFDGFMKTPFGTSGDGKITAAGMNDQYTLHHELQMYDTLDISLEADICTDIPCTIPADIRSQREDVFLFKTRDDLDALGYEVVSHRWRTNKDSSFRRKNIASSFHHIGNIRIIMPGETIDFLTAAEYDEDRQENYEIGYVLIDGKEEKGYGGGICGASTAVYQGTLTNTGLRFTQHRVHSKRYHGLYDAHINHAHITTPGLDSTVYAGSIDLSITNISPRPIILTMNYDGSRGGHEEVFSLSLPAHAGSLQYISGSNPYARNGGCYTRNINGEQRTSCYKEVKR